MLSRKGHSNSLGDPHLEISGFGAGQESGSLMNHWDTNELQVQIPLCSGKPHMEQAASSTTTCVQNLKPTHVGTNT